MEDNLGISADRKITPPPQSSSGRANNGEAPMLGLKPGLTLIGGIDLHWVRPAPLVNILCHKRPLVRVAVDKFVANVG
jgi:hypothetical protein